MDMLQEKEHSQAHLRFLECMDRINRVIHRSDDAEQMLWSVLRTAFSMFGCDRIWLFHPCDPASPTYRIPVEVTRPEYPGAHALNIDVPMRPMGDRFCAKALAADGPVHFGPETDPPIFRELTETFGVRSQLSMAIYPRVGKPWMIGMHQCSHERVWSAEDRELFEGIARRIGEGLSTLLLLRDLEKLVEERTEELNRANEELKRAKEAAEEASRAKSEFLAVMSHEIRTPLSVVIASIDYLLHASSSPQQKAILEMADSSADRLHALIEDILDFSRIEARRVEIRREPFNLREFLEKTVELFRMQAREKGLELRWEIDPETPATLHGDPDRLAQVLINLVGNALKFTDRGGVAVRVDSRPEGVSFSVRDTGIGIADDQKSRLFESFSQVDSSLTRRYGGTGLGLAISKALVELMGGTIGVESVQGKGSVFSFSLPPSRRRTDREERGAAEPESAPPPSSRPARILLVDDDPLVRNIMELMLLERGWEVVTAGGGRQALQQVEEGRFDLILMDLQMPGMSGLEATRLIRERESAAGRRTPVVALTAHVRPEDRGKCCASGMDAFLPKPVKMESLYETVEKHLNAPRPSP